MGLVLPRDRNLENVSPFWGGSAMGHWRAWGQSYPKRSLMYPSPLGADVLRDFRGSLALSRNTHPKVTGPATPSGPGCGTQ